LTTRAASKLIVYTPGFVAFTPKHVQASKGTNLIGLGYTALVELAEQ
jgi:hypothetical protein